MTLSLRSLLLLGALSVGAFACAAPSEEEAPPADSGENEDELRAQKITEADDGKTIVVQEGRSFTVALGANATTGYEWKVVSTTRTLGYPYRSRYFPDQTGAVGSGGEARFYWKTSGALSVVGKHDIELAYARGDGKPAKTVHFTIDVQPANAANASVVKIGGASGQTFDVKVGQDILVELAGPQVLGWQVTSTSRSLGYPEVGWVQGEGAVGQSGHSTFLWKTKNRPISVEGAHKVVLEFDRGHGDGVSRFEFTANIR